MQEFLGLISKFVGLIRWLDFGGLQLERISVISQICQTYLGKVGMYADWEVCFVVYL